MTSTSKSQQGWLTAIRSTLALSVTFGLVFPLIIVALAQLLFPWQANGSLIRKGDRIVGSALVGQPVTGQGYFQGRPSAANNDPMAVSGSNEAPSNPELRRQVVQRSLAIQSNDRVPADRIPVDLVTASGSGIDPDISPQAAELQVDRVARERHLPIDQVETLVKSHTQRAQWGLFGQPRVNVLALNMDLDAIGKADQ